MGKESKSGIILDICKELNFFKAIIFCNSKSELDILSDIMQKKEIKVLCLHSELFLGEQLMLMKEFIEGTTRVVISNDFSHRLLKKFPVSIVINYDIPVYKEDYSDRISGISNSKGTKGKVINLILPEEEGKLDSIRKFYNIKIEQLPQDLKLNDF